MTLAIIILALVSAQRLGELVLARHNTAALLARGGREVAPGHYPALVLMHTAWLAALWLWGYDSAVNLPLLAIFVVLQALRVWVIATLGTRWTTRIIILPGAPLVTNGPYRYVSHPNYIIVVAEIAVLPLALGLPWVALVFTVLNALLLVMRLQAENLWLADVRISGQR